MKLTIEDAQALAECLPSRSLKLIPVSAGVFEVVVNRDYDEKRWTMVMELIIRTTEGTLWRAFYERGLTENQFVRPFEYHDDDEVEFQRVIGQPKTVIEYVPWGHQMTQIIAG